MQLAMMFLCTLLITWLLAFKLNLGQDFLGLGLGLVLFEVLIQVNSLALVQVQFFLLLGRVQVLVLLGQVKGLVLGRGMVLVPVLGPVLDLDLVMLIYTLILCQLVAGPGPRVQSLFPRIFCIFAVMCCLSYWTGIIVFTGRPYVMIIGIGSVAIACGAEFCWAFTDYVYKMKILFMTAIIIIFVSPVTMSCTVILVFSIAYCHCSLG